MSDVQQSARLWQRGEKTSRWPGVVAFVSGGDRDRMANQPVTKRLMATGRPLFDHPAPGMPERNPLGVSGERFIHRNGNGWEVLIRGEHIGTRSTVADAVAVRDHYLATGERTPSPRQIQRERRRVLAASQPASSDERYVYRSGLRWRVMLGRPLTHYGTYDTIPEAVAARNRVLAEQGRPIVKPTPVRPVAAPSVPSVPAPHAWVRRTATGYSVRADGEYLGFDRSLEAAIARRDAWIARMDAEREAA